LAPLPREKNVHNAFPQGAADAPAFILTIDTEGDDAWSRPQQMTTHNAAYLPRFQQLCERFGFAPTYLTNYEMAQSAAFREFANDALKRGTAEVGMHMHPWDSPPIVPLGARDWYDQPYATEYPEAVVDQKVEYMTRLLEDTFQSAVTSHRAGRWGFNSSYARSLIRHGYEVDCSVTPRVTWEHHPGSPAGSGGPDFSNFPDDAYYLDPGDISRAGVSTLLEVPMSIVEGKRPWNRALARRVLGRKGPRIVWLRPDGGNLDGLLQVVETVRARRRAYLQFTLHSSELMPGGSPTFPTARSIEKLYRDLEVLFDAVSRHFAGRTLTEFARRFRSQSSVQA
jgi:hypothetical protein